MPDHWNRQAAGSLGRDADMHGSEAADHILLVVKMCVDLWEVADRLRARASGKAEA